MLRADRLRCRSDVGRTEFVRRLVHQLACEVLRLADDSSSLRGSVCDITDYDKFLSRFLVVPRTVAVRLKIADNGAFDARNGLLLGQFPRSI